MTPPLALLADLAVATDPALRRAGAAAGATAAARPGARGQPRRRGTRRMVSRAGALDGDLDLDRTLERSLGRRPQRRATSSSPASSPPPHASVCLLVDRSGSMSGHAVALAAVAAAAVVSARGERLRCSVVAFASEPLVLLVGPAGAARDRGRR